MEIMGITDTRYRTAKQLGTLDPRKLKRDVQVHNLQFGTSDEPQAQWYILSCRYGYKLTNNLEEIDEDLKRREDNAKKMLGRVSEQRRNIKALRKSKAMGGMF